MPWFDEWPPPTAGTTLVPFPFQAANIADAQQKAGTGVTVSGPYTSLGQAENAKPPTTQPVPTSGGPTGTPGGPPLKDPAAVRIAVVQFAVAQVGKPYVWGGDGPPQSTGFDCSGLTYEAYLHAGVTIPRVAAGQQSAGTVVDQSNLQPGDLVFAGTPAFHVGMFIGNGEICVSDHPGVNVRTRTFVPSEWTGGFRSMVAGGIVLTGFPGSGIISGGFGALHALEGLVALVKWFTPQHVERAGKIALGILIIAGALVIMNRKKIEVAAGKAAKAAEVAAL